MTFKKFVRYAVIGGIWFDYFDRSAEMTFDIAKSLGMDASNPGTAVSLLMVFVLLPINALAAVCVTQFIMRVISDSKCEREWL